MFPAVSNDSVSVVPTPPSTLPNTPPAKEFQPSQKSTFEIDGFHFPLPDVDPTTRRMTATGVLNMLMIAIASSSDPKIRKVLKDAQVEITDITGRRFFPQEHD